MAESRPIGNTFTNGRLECRLETFTGTSRESPLLSAGESEPGEIVERLRARGPAVILGDPRSHFVRQLGAYWKTLGLDVAVVSTGPNLPSSDETGLRVIDSLPFRPLWTRLLRPLNVLLRPLERRLPVWYARRYRRRTGRDHPQPWEGFWVDHFWDSFSRARAALSLAPAFVFGQEAAAYGFATGLCRGVPRILFPWGGDIFLSCECSPPIDRMLRAAFRRCDLIVPSSLTGRRRIIERFGVPAEKVESLSWGVDLQQFAPADGVKRDEIRRRWNIPEESKVVFNARRFAPVWGCEAALAACLAVARDPACYCLLLGGGGDTDRVADARRQIEAAGLAERVRILDDAISLEEYAELASVADVALSLMTLGDMRSSSVLQTAAAGCTPVLFENPEYRTMADEGFAARFVPPDAPEPLVEAIRELIDDSQARAETARRNREYLSRYEDYHAQMTKLLQRIDNVSRKYSP